MTQYTIQNKLKKPTLIHKEECKMRNAKWLLLVAAVFTVFMLVSCAEAPQQEMDNAVAALDAAKQVEADRYAVDEFTAAQDTLAKAKAAVDEQNGKFAMTRNYDKARTLLANATTMAENAKMMAVENKEKVKAEVAVMSQDLAKEITQTATMISKAPKGKEGKAALQMMRAELDAVEASLAEVDGMVQAGDYMSAKDKLDAGLQKVMSLQDELNAAMSKVRGR
jgi:uncharacterized protein involved in type VI secretion and phage assembly